jgi:hypothetical protein
MPYKIHLQNRESPQPIRVAGQLIETQIVPETRPLREVETKEEAEEVMRGLIAGGTPPSTLYAVGYDWPLAAKSDA